jgi:hypothetical protein
MLNEIVADPKSLADLAQKVMLNEIVADPKSLADLA